MIRYTPRDIPKELDLLVREEAMKQILYYDLDDLAGTWKDDPEFDAAIADQDRIEELLWD